MFIQLNDKWFRGTRKLSDDFGSITSYDFRGGFVSRLLSADNVSWKRSVGQPQLSENGIQSSVLE